MNAAAVLLTIAIADLLTLAWLTMRSRAVALGLVVVAAVGWILLLTLGFGYSWLFVVVIVVAAVCWSAILASTFAPKLVIPLGLLLVAGCAALILVPSLTTAPNGPITENWQSSGAIISLATTLAVVAVLAFLAHSANVVVRAVLTLARRADHAPDQPQEAESAAPWIVAGRWRWARVQVLPPEPQAPRVISTMRGGRWIGPLERWAIVALGLAGALPIIGAIMAGKGIVRFPEISADRGIGSKAEEFLVGSLLSWSLAGAGVALIVGVTALAG